MNELPSDAQVIRNVLAGDTEAFGVLVHRYQNVFARYAKSQTGSEDEAADVIQESFVRAYTHLRYCTDPTRFKGWLFRIISNECRTYVRRRRRRKTDRLAADPHASVPAPDDPERALVAADLRRKLHEALRTLPAEQRDALALKYAEELPLPHIAELLSISVPALKMRLLRGRRALKQKLQGVVV